MFNLSYCFITEEQMLADGRFQRSSHYVTMLDQSSTHAPTTWAHSTGSRTLFATSLQVVLRGLIDHVMGSSKYGTSTGGAEGPDRPRHGIQ
jgi:hypothetical protein